MKSQFNLIKIIAAFTVAILSAFMSSESSVATATFSSRVNGVRESLKSQASTTLDSQSLTNNSDEFDQRIQQNWCNSQWCNVR